MGPLLFALFAVLPLVEIAMFVVVGGAIGLWWTLAAVVGMGIVGGLVLRLQGLALLQEIRGTMGQGILPGRAIANAMMVAIAGVLLIIPGFFSDIVALLLLLPPVREGIYALLRSRMRVMATTSAAYGRTAPDGDPRLRGGGPGTIDLDEEDWRPR